MSRSATATPWWLVLLEGIAALVIGILLVTDPIRTLFTLVVFVGAYLFVIGVIDLVMLFVDQRQWGWRLFTGVLGIVAGLAVLRHPAWATVLVPAAVVWILAILAIVMGAVTLLRSVVAGGWGLTILGVISIILGLILLFNTVVSALVLIYVVGIWSIVGGIVAIAAAFRLRELRRAGEMGRPVVSGS
ncbi:MAG TPA: DUF308 domain-containing protein [Candidatus Dormibacteraeota bacterium]